MGLKAVFLRARCPLKGPWTGPPTRDVGIILAARFGPPEEVYFLPVQKQKFACGNR